MDIAVTGSSGMIGTALVAALEARGDTVRRVVRRDPGPGRVLWSPSEGTIDTDGLAGVDAVVHLAGEGIAEKRWNDEQKRRIRNSRVLGTTLLAATLASLDPKPAVLLSGSAIGIYGCRGDDVLTEDTPIAHEGFLPGVVSAWETATAAAADAGIRVAHLRTGLVLSPSGGMLAREVPLFRFGLGGRLGDGLQWWPWISIRDHVAATLHLLTAEVEGPVNLTAPEPVTNAGFTTALGRVLGRPTFLPIPSFGPALVLGRELAEALLFCSARVVPAKLQASGFAFQDTDLEPTLRQLLDRE